jgi:hypothetical protein
MIILGSLFSAFVLLAAAELARESWTSGHNPFDASRWILSFANFGIWGALLIWTGIGSIRARRWVRPLVFAVTAIAVILSLPLTGRVVSLLEYQRYGSPNIEPVIEMLLCFGIPFAAFSYYRSDRIRNVLRSRDFGATAAKFPDDPLFAWSAGCVLFGFTKAISVTSSRAYLPRTEPDVQWILLYILLAAAGLLCYRRIRFAWLATVLISTALAIISAVAFAHALTATNSIDQYAIARLRTAYPAAHGLATAVPPTIFMRAHLSISVPALFLAGIYCAATLYGIHVRRYLQSNCAAAEPIRSRSIQRNIPQHRRTFLDQIVIRLPPPIDPGKLETAFEQQLMGRQIVRQRLGGNGAAFAPPGLLDDLVQHRRRQSLPAEIVINPQIHQLQRR